MNYDQLFKEKIIRSLVLEDVEPLKNYLLQKRGWVYIAKSKNNQFLKIGRTGKNPLVRSETLETVGVLHKFDIVFALPVFNQFIAEANVHKRLARFRVEKEFFSISETKAIEALEKESLLEVKLLNRFINTELISPAHLEEDIFKLSQCLRKN